MNIIYSKLKFRLKFLVPRTFFLYIIFMKKFYYCLLFDFICLLYKEKFDYSLYDAEEKPVYAFIYNDLRQCLL